MTPALTKHLRPAYAECGGVFMKKNRLAFKFMYELKAIGNEYLLSDVVYPDYYLTVMFDEKDRVFMISYQKNQKYELL